MKPILALSLTAMLLGGCMSTYEITLNSGTKLSSPNKPKLVGGIYVYKNSQGQEMKISSSKVKSIERK